MAVYTHLTSEQMRQYVRHFHLGQLQSYRGVAAGTINSIYDVQTDRGRYILRVLENRIARDARFEQALLDHLHARGVLVPQPMGQVGEKILSISQKQHVSVFGFAKGQCLKPREVTTDQTAAIGAFLGSMHLALKGFRRRRRNPFSPEGITAIQAECATALKTQRLKRHLLAMAPVLLALGRSAWPTDVPTGVVHGDLFVDNAHFSRRGLEAVLDFEMAAMGPFVYDLAVALCDWSFVGKRYIPARARAMVAAYDAVRPLSTTERRRLFACSRYAAARFTLTRFYDFEVHHRPGVTRLHKDYREFLGRWQRLGALGAKGFLCSVGL